MMLKKIGLEELLKEISFNERDLKIAELLIIGRMVYPGSEWYSTLGQADECHR